MVITLLQEETLYLTPAALLLPIIAASSVEKTARDS
jgi:hypothetical protein